MTDRPVQRATQSRSADNAKAQGATFYKLPSELTIERDVDRLLWGVVGRINATGWVWTAESCQGHPDAASPADTGWTHNTEPFLRLVCHQDDEGHMLTALARSLNPPIDSDAIERGWPTTQGARIYREERGEYAEVLAYLPARNVMERDAGVAAFARFANALRIGGDTRLDASASGFGRGDG